MIGSIPYLGWDGQNIQITVAGQIDFFSKISLIFMEIDFHSQQNILVDMKMLKHLVYEMEMEEKRRI